jgi:anti-sigma factor RsiW
VNCDEARFALEADPSDDDAALAAHVMQCPDCAVHRRELRELDRRVRAALEVPVPDTARARFDAADLAARTDNVVALPAGAQAHVRRFAGGLALAASVAGVAVLAGLLWAGFPRDSLAADVVAHMAHEPDAWSTTAPLAAPEVARVLARSGLRLRPGAVEVTYASTCWFRARRVPHLVVRTATGPVTVMILTGERLAAREHFDEGGFRGVLVPAGAATLAVLAHDEADVEAAAARTLAALET